MLEAFRSNRSQLLLLAVGYLAAGLMLLIRPEFFMDIICYVIGAVIIAFGVLGILRQVQRRHVSILLLVLELLVIVAGICCITNTELLHSVLPILIGVLLVLDGILNLSHVIALRRYHAAGQLLVLVLGIITLAVGALILFNPYPTARLTFRLIGLGLIYSGISDLVILYRMNQAVRKHAASNPSAQVIEVEGHLIDEEKEG